jgi:hypothetical protein
MRIPLVERGATVALRDANGGTALSSWPSMSPGGNCSTSCGIREYIRVAYFPYIVFFPLGSAELEV